MRNKRAIAPLQMLISGAILVLIAIITVSIGISVNDSMTTSFRDTTGTVTDEDIGPWGNGGINSTLIPDLVSGSETVTVNATGVALTTVAAANYTMEYTGATITFIGIGYNGNETLIDYSYYEHTADYNASVSGTTGLAAFADYWTSIVSIIILVVIVGLFAYFRGGTGGVEIR